MVYFVFTLGKEVTKKDKNKEKILMHFFQYWKKKMSCVVLDLICDYYPFIFWILLGYTHLGWGAMLMESSMSRLQCDSQEEFPTAAKCAGAAAK